jgi:hypothetical protein
MSIEDGFQMNSDTSIQKRGYQTNKMAKQTELVTHSRSASERRCPQKSSDDRSFRGHGAKLASVVAAHVKPRKSGPTSMRAAA